MPAAMRRGVRRRMGHDAVMMTGLPLLFLLLAPASVTGQGQGQVQVAASCTASLISTFTPCLNFVTGSTNGGGSPTQQCCRAVAGVVRTGADCACLILTGNVPFSLPINRTLAISLPKVCKSLSVPLQCRDTATQIPAPGPVAFAPALPPLPPLPPESSVDATATSPAVEAPPAIMQGQRPVVVLSSAWRNARGLLAPAPLVLLVLASILV
ncbi:non-specific lipid-transfer protein-like protein At2g13820 [Brachypodium distachyon]|nr:non-specific lipid-transfer protein-like protein At2g13820 [Brachypodium distachyon]|eukprot:XP_003559327.4 non-specific lipid-transfer protein-like protein At2g13820 [Brachypodium distachyon]